jgi:uncharacterized protein YqeY
MIPYVTGRLKQLLAMFPSIARACKNAADDSRLQKIASHPFKQRKERLSLVESALRHVLADDRNDPQSRLRVIETIMETDDLKKLVDIIQEVSSEHEAPSGFLGSFTSSIRTWLKGESDVEAKLRNIRKQGRDMDDSAFLSQITRLVDLEPLLAEVASTINRIASDYLQNVIRQKTSGLATQLRQTQRESLRGAYEQELAQAKTQLLYSALKTFLTSTANSFLINDAR